MAPPLSAELLTNSESMIVTSSAVSKYIAPPEFAIFSAKVELIIDTLFFVTYIAPPILLPVFLINLDSLIVTFSEAT